MAQHGLELGSLDLASDLTHEDGYRLRVLGDNASFGESQAVVREIVSMLADGNYASYDRAGNRTVSFNVQVEASDGVALQAGEVALRRELYRSNEIVWTPPADFSPPTVFEVITSEMAPQFNDIDELRNRRVFRVSLTCAPFARSLEPVTVEALVSGTTTVDVDTCDSKTGWVGTRSGVTIPVLDTWTPGSVGLIELDEAFTSPETWTLTRTGSIDLTATPYLVVQLKTISNKQGLRVSVYADGVLLPVLEQRQMVGTDTYRVTLDARGLGTVSTLHFSHTSIAGEKWQGLFVRNVARTDVAPGVTFRQLSRVIETGGTERTPANIHIYSGYDMANMETAIVHTHPADGTGYAPPLRRWRVSGNTPISAPGDTLSLWTEPMKPASSTIEVPNSTLPTDGYVLAIRVQTSVAISVGIDWAVQTFFPSTTTTLEGVTQGTTTWKAKEIGKFEIVPLATLALPTIRGYDGTTRVSFRCLAAEADLFWDEAFLFRMGDDCALTIIDENVADHVWLESPNGSTPVPTIWEGFAADRSSARHPGARVKSMGSHVLHPDGTVLHTSAITNDLRAEATYFRRYHSNAGGE